jgi:hypothetical protein
VECKKGCAFWLRVALSAAAAGVGVGRLGSLGDKCCDGGLGEVGLWRGWGGGIGSSAAMQNDYTLGLGPTRAQSAGPERREAGRSTSPMMSFERPICPAAVLQATVRARWRGTEHERSERGCARLELSFYRAKEGGKPSASSKGRQWPWPLSQSGKMP